eukprot:6204304-Pleurochrysis_carterae.AAC.1
MREAKPVGVLVGRHAHGVGGAVLHKEHHVCTSSFEKLDPPHTPEGSGRLRSAAQRAGGKQQGKQVDRKGYHTYRCGDV